MSEGRPYDVEPDARQGGPLVALSDLADLEPAIKRVLGRAVYVHEIDYLPAGRAVAYLGTTQPRDTSPRPDQPELSFLNYAPVGAAVITPMDDGLAAHLPARDALAAAAAARTERENQHRAQVVPALLNWLDDRRTMHHEAVGDYGLHDADSLVDLDLEPTELFHLGRELGMETLASAVHRRLSGRLDAPFQGRRRWAAPDYAVVRQRRTAPITDWPTLIDQEPDR